MPEDILLGVLPFFHIYGQIVVMLSSVIAGSKMVTLPRFDPEQYLGSCTKYRVRAARLYHTEPAQGPALYKFNESRVQISAWSPSLN